MAYLRLVTTYLAIVVALLLVVAQNQQIKIPAKILTASSDGDLDLRDSCPYQEDLDTAVKSISDSVFDILKQMFSSQIPQCGDGLWYRVAYLNTSDPSQQCPSAWIERTFNRIRVCGRPTSTTGSCRSVLYPVGGQYSRVCGRVIGYQFGSPDVFVATTTHRTRSLTIDQCYLDGVSITHGKINNRTHIWSYVAGGTENGTMFEFYNCPCSNSNNNPPNFVESSYYCESANQDAEFAINTFFPDDPLWDGQQCDNEGTCCTGANNPPWFNVDLPDTTSDDIEVRICLDQGTTDEDTPIQLLELYVQ